MLWKQSSHSDSKNLQANLLPNKNGVCATPDESRVDTAYTRADLRNQATQSSPLTANFLNALVLFTLDLFGDALSRNLPRQVAFWLWRGCGLVLRGLRLF